MDPVQKSQEDGGECLDLGVEALVPRVDVAPLLDCHGRKGFDPFIDLGRQSSASGLAEIGAVGDEGANLLRVFGRKNVSAGMPKGISWSSSLLSL